MIFTGFVGQFCAITPGPQAAVTASVNNANTMRMIIMSCLARPQRRADRRDQSDQVACGTRRMRILPPQAELLPSPWRGGPVFGELVDREREHPENHLRRGKAKKRNQRRPERRSLTSRGEGKRGSRKKRGDNAHA